MATVGNQQSWLPYDGSDNKGCSQGFCSIYCPQWCYVFFPPPPPLTPPVSEDESGTALSPTVIAVITILSTVLLLISYYIFVSKSFRSRHIHLEEPGAAAANTPSHGHEEGRVVQHTGLDEALINTVWMYKRDNGIVDGADCSVCLGEFKEEEIIRLLPNCSHAFHLPCIDTWLKSHPNCPLCRDDVMSAAPMEPEPDSRIAASFPSVPEHEMVLEIENAETREEEEVEGDHGAVVVEIGEEEDAEQPRHQRRASIVDVMRQSMEEECIAGKDSRWWKRNGRERNRGGGRNRALHCVMIPVRMKRLVSEGRLFLNRQERQRTSPLQV